MSGSDVYVVDNPGDVVIEAADGGPNDTIRTSVDFVLPDSVFVEQLIATRWIDIRGNGQANRILGSDEVNVLDGGGGDDELNGWFGRDELWGGEGADRFVFDATTHGPTNHDWLLDFTPADDTIVLDRTIFNTIAAIGELASSAFRAGSAAIEADDRIVYDAATGRIFYYQSGSAGYDPPEIFASVPIGTPLTSADFLVVA